MKKWLIAFLASAVLIGCGGGTGLGGSTAGSSAGSSAGSTSGSTGGGQPLPVPNLGSFAQVQLLYLSGQGRRAPGSLIMVTDNIRVFNSATDYYPKDQVGSGSGLRVQLDGYTTNQFLFDVPLVAGGASKTYGQLPLVISQIDQDTGSGTTTVFSGPPLTISPFFDTNIVLFPGRQTTAQVVINDATLGVDIQGDPVFNRPQFEADNYSPTNQKINGFLSDMVTFDVSNVPAADRPLMNSGNRATSIHLSGDSIGISSGFDSVGSFEMLSPVVIDPGVLKAPTTVGGKPAPGIYTVMEPDPRDPFGSAKLVALQGIWRPYTKVLSNIGTFAMVAIPTTRSTTTHQVVLFNRDANGSITAMWQGVIDANGSTSGNLRLYSLDQLPDATATPRAIGKISFNKENGILKQGTFNMTLQPTNFPFPLNGKFMVLR